MSDKPKIFCWVNSGVGTDWQVGMAIAEDGTVLASHVSSHRGFYLHDMGLTSDWKHDRYSAHYPNGFALVDVPDSEVMTHPGLMAAIEQNAIKHKPTVSP